jgi:hypothetical protein
LLKSTAVTKVPVYFFGSLLFLWCLCYLLHISLSTMHAEKHMLVNCSWHFTATGTVKVWWMIQMTIISMCIWNFSVLSALIPFTYINSHELFTDETGKAKKYPSTKTSWKFLRKILHQLSTIQYHQLLNSICIIVSRQNDFVSVWLSPYTFQLLVTIWQLRM